MEHQVWNRSRSAIFRNNFTLNIRVGTGAEAGAVLRCGSDFSSTKTMRLLAASAATLLVTYAFIL
jgi:hypothetical protein